VSYEKNKPSIDPWLIAAITVLHRNVFCGTHFFRFCLHFPVPGNENKKDFHLNGSKE
jgi:hypothetical protein